MPQPRQRSRVWVRAPEAADMPAFLEAVKASASLHKPWVSPPATPERFRAWVKRAESPQFRPFLVCRRQGGAFVGVFNVSEIVHGNFQSAFLGYYAFAGQDGQGLMKEGLVAVVRQAFSKLKLHRLEANIQPANAKSIALVRSCGFRNEGFSPRYLKVGGRWRDHERWAITAD